MLHKSLVLFLSLAITFNAIAGQWPDKPYSEVRAYYYNPKGEMALPIIKNGRISKTVQKPKEGIVLTKDQIKRVMAAVTGKHKQDKISPCFDPRHAFVFYDKKRQPIATIEICFECLTKDNSPDGLSQTFDLPALAFLLEELGFPLNPEGMTAKQFVKKYKE